MKRVSIIIPCYNYGAFLAEAIESALAQTYPDIEILVMDDGSRDHTPEVARQFGSRIQYLRTPNRGHGATLNDALRRITGTYYICLDADNSLLPDYVSKTVAVLESAGPGIDFVYTQREYFESGSGISTAPAYDLKRLKIRNYIDTCALIRTVLGRRHGYDEKLIQADYDFYLTLAEQGSRGVLLNEPLFRYRIHSSSMSHGIMSKYRHLETLRPILRKHAAFYSPEERALAIRAARDRIILAVVTNRLPQHSLSVRWNDLVCLIIKGRPPLTEAWNQLRYLASPAIFSPLRASR